MSKVLELILFADDTNIFYSHTDASYLMEVVNLELKKITCWFYTNKLSINVKKSNFIIFRPRQNRQTLDLAFNISNYSIDRVKEATFLGIILDEHLTWKSHTVILKKVVGENGERRMSNGGYTTERNCVYAVS